MPLVITDINAALTWLEMRTDYTVTPTVTVPELESILSECERATIWQPNTAYTFGAVVIPTAAARNGHRYKVMRFDGSGVASAATEPSWPRSREAVVSDGNLTWVEDGIDYDVLWDLGRAAYKVWKLKKARAVTCTDFHIGNNSASRSQFFTHCDNMMRSFASTVIG